MRRRRRRGLNSGTWSWWAALTRWAGHAPRHSSMPHPHPILHPLLRPPVQLCARITSQGVALRWWTPPFRCMRAPSRPILLYCSSSSPTCWRVSMLLSLLLLLAWLKARSEPHSESELWACSVLLSGCLLCMVAFWWRCLLHECLLVCLLVMHVMRYFFVWMLTIFKVYIIICNTKV